MKTIVVDATYPRLVKKNHWYELQDNLVSTGNIEIKLDMDLRVAGSIKAGGSIRAVGDIWAVGSIKAVGYIKADGDIWAGGYIWADGDITCFTLVGGTIKSGTLVETGKS